MDRKGYQAVKASRAAQPYLLKAPVGLGFQGATQAKLPVALLAGCSIITSQSNM